MNLNYHDILWNDEQIGPYPTDKLPRVDIPTTHYFKPVEEWTRRSEKENTLLEAGAGKYGPKLKDAQKRMTVQEPLGAAFVNIQKALASIPLNPVASVKAPIPDDPRIISRHIKSLGYFLGADQIGICKLPVSCIYTEDAGGNPIEADYKYAIVFLKRKHIPTMAASDGNDSIMDPISFQAYQQISLMTETMCNYIRRLGYDSDVSHMFRYKTLMGQLILEAGLGEASRMGLIVNPFFGANFKSAAVLTNLPLEIDKPIDFKLQSFCENCRLCVGVCPMKAISPDEKVKYNGYETWVIDRVKCASNSISTRLCGICTKLCPWSHVKTDPQEFADWDGDVYKLHERAYKRMNDLMRNDWKDPDEETRQWWFDLEKHDMKSDELFEADWGKDHKKPPEESMLSRIQSMRTNYVPDRD